MRLTMKTVFAALILVVIASANLKIGYINSDDILAKYQGTQSAQNELQTLKLKWEQEANTMQQKLLEMQKNYESQKSMLSADKRAAMEKEMQDEYIKYQTYLQQKFGQTGELAQKQAQLLQPILEKVNTIIGGIAEKNNYDFIFDSRAGMLYGKKEYDMTDEILKELNAGK